MLRMTHALILIGMFVMPLRAAEVLTIAGNGDHEYSGDGGPALKAGIGGPFGVELGPDAALYVCETENHVIRRVDLKDGTISTVVGTGIAGYSGDGGPARKARCREPYELRFDAVGNLYFVEMKNHVVRKASFDERTITTLVGTGMPGFSGDGGPGTEAQLNVPHSLCLDPQADEARGQIYIADIGNHRVRAYSIASGQIQTLVGNGKQAATIDGAPFEKTSLNGPRTMAMGEASMLFLALREGNAILRLDLKQRTVHHVAGTGKSGYAGDGGPAKVATLAGPKGIAIGPKGDIYLADTESHTIRVIDHATGIITTLVGDGQPGDGPDGDPLHCRLHRPHGICVDPQGRVYIGDSSNNKVRMLIPD